MRPLLFTCAASAALLAAAPASAALIKFTVTLDGAQEVPVGDPDGSGTAVLIFDDVAQTYQWEISVNNIDLPITAAHIHNAAAGVNGPVRLDFFATLSGGPVFDTDVALLLANPTDYYVNVHNAAFPGGAIRGQLGRPDADVPEPGALGIVLTGLAGLTALNLARRRDARRIRRR